MKEQEVVPKYLHLVGWGEGHGAFVSPIKVIRVGVGLYIKNNYLQSRAVCRST